MQLDQSVTARAVKQQLDTIAKSMDFYIDHGVYLFDQNLVGPVHLIDDHNAAMRIARALAKELGWHFMHATIWRSGHGGMLRMPKRLVNEIALDLMVVAEPLPRAGAVAMRPHQTITDLSTHSGLRPRCSSWLPSSPRRSSRVGELAPQAAARTITSPRFSKGPTT